MPSFRSLPRSVVGVIALVVVLAAAGCADGSEAPSPAPTAAGGNSVALPPQPFDILRAAEHASIELVHRRLRDNCLADAGYSQNRDLFGSWRPLDPLDAGRVSARNFGPTSEDEARRLGFGQDFPGEPPRIISFDSSYDANLERCSAEAWQQLGPSAQQTMLAFTDLMNQLLPYRAEVHAEIPEDVPAKLYDCMVGKGYQTDRNAFLGTPSYRSYGVEFGSLEPAEEATWSPANEPGTVQVGPAIPPRRYTPTPAESDLAVAWFQCDQQVGWVQAQMAAAFAVQQRYVDRFETQIAELNTQITALARDAAALA